MHCPDCGSEMNQITPRERDERFLSWAERCGECEKTFIVCYDEQTGSIQIEEKGWGK